MKPYCFSLNRTMLQLKARYVFPGDAEPIPDGVVQIDRSRIVAVGRRASDDYAVEDLGNVALLPGLVNAHTHLDLSGIDCPLGAPGMSLVDWLSNVVASRSDTSAAEAVTSGIRESIRHGTTLLADIAAADTIWPSVVPLDRRSIVFGELIGPTSQRVDDACRRAAEYLAAVQLAATQTSNAWRPGLSPHAPYSVHPELLCRVVRLANDEQVPLAMHLAESPEEIELLATGRGPFRPFLENLGAWTDNLVPVGTRPLDYLKQLATAPRALIVHGNYLDDEEIVFLAGESNHMPVVFCPRTHAYFDHAPYPLAKMLAAGVTVALGTDSRASSPNLSVLEEMRHVAAHYPSVEPSTVLRLGTLGGATALGCAERLGTLAPGKLANLAAVALPDRDDDPYALLFDSTEPVVGTWCRGTQLGE